MCNGYLPESEVLAAIGPVAVKVPKVRDVLERASKFNSTLVPPTLGAHRSGPAWFSQKGISTPDTSEALKLLIGNEAKVLA